MTYLQNESECFLNQSDFVNKTCFKFSEHDYNIVLWGNNGVAILAVVACCFTILIMLFQKAYKEFVHRLAFYLTITALVVSIVLLIRVAATEQRCGHLVVKDDNYRLCAAMGFLLEYSALVALVFLFWVTFHIFMMAVFKQNFYTSRKNEVACVVIAIVVPFLISIVPFIPFNQNGIMYGLTVPWCWIKATDENCNAYNEGFSEQIALFYGPLTLLILFNFVVMVAAVIVLCRGTKAENKLRLQNQYKKALKETWPLILYPLFFNIIFGLAIGPRVYYNITQNDTLGLWVIHTMSLPCLTLFMPLAFILHPNTLKKLNCRQLKITANRWRHHSLQSHTHFVVSKENSDCDDPLIIEGNRTELGAYRTFLDVDNNS